MVNLIVLSGGFRTELGRVLLLVAVAALAVAAPARGEEAAAPPEVVDPHLNGDDDAYYNRQAEAFLNEVGTTLERVRPQAPEPEERRMALMLLDAVLHDPYAPNRPPVQAFYHSRIEHAVSEIEKARVEAGAMVWKIYNMGFVVRTPSVTLGFDLYRGPSAFRYADATGKSTIDSKGFPFSDDLAVRLVSQCDALFISHQHRDHADPFVAQTFIDQGKPVVAPPEVFEGQPLQEKVTHLKRDAGAVHLLPIQQASHELKAIVYPGQQYQGGGVPNNVVLVTTPEGLAFVHDGDQINDPYPQYQEDFTWIDRVHETHHVDVLMTNNWTNDILRLTKGFGPEAVFTGHEDELGHQLWDRVAYWGDAEFIQSNLPELKASKYPVLVMTWGESYHYQRNAP